MPLQGPKKGQKLSIVSGFKGMMGPKPPTAALAGADGEMIAVPEILEVDAGISVLYSKSFPEGPFGEKKGVEEKEGVYVENNSDILPNVEKATINLKKLTEYALNPNHPVGGNKAKVFESALGYNQSNADALMKQIYEKLPNSKAVLGKSDAYGQRYTVDISITGTNSKTVNVRTGWIIRTDSEIPELTTLFVKD